MEKDLGRLKKDFQKVISAIRKDRQKLENIKLRDFPKAMMTNQQVWKNTATVNCGGQCGSYESTIEIANAVISDDRFIGFLEKWEASAQIERESSGSAQIRIYY